jgi:DNA invertase Pin-like site-specific DNA recombinase
MRIRKGASLIEEYSPDQPQLPVDRKIIQYIRQSSPGQVKHNIQSKMQQDGMLERRLLAYGWTHDLIIKIEADQDISGQKTRFQREGLDQLYRMIESGEAFAIACYDASRLWRDRTHVWYNDFIQVLKQHDIPVVMFNHVYWCSRSADEEGLREEFRQAAFYLKHIYEKVNPAKLQAVQYGMSYGGGAIPMGYLVKAEPGRKFFVVYEPHAEKIRYLFKRFRELNGNLARLGRELVATGFCFPAFEDGVPVPKNMRLYFDDQLNGYVMKTRKGLAGILSNPVYLGWYVYSGVVISKTAHEPIVPYDDFLYAFNRLSPYTLDGEEREKISVPRTYQTMPALLEDVLTGNGVKAYVIGTMYRAMRGGDYLDSDNYTELNVPVKIIDRAFSDVFVQVLTGIKKAASIEGEPTAMDALAATIDQLSKEKISEIGTIDEALKNVEQGIKEWELAKHVAMKQLYEPGVEEATRQLKDLHATKDMLLEKAKAATQQKAELARTESLITEATTQWGKMLFERKRQLVDLIVASAEMTMASPHILKLVIELKPPVEGRLVGYIYRKHGIRTAWTDAENSILREMYSHAGRVEILKALPERNWNSIVQQAGELDLNRPKMPTEQMPSNLSWADMQMLDMLTLSGYAPVKGGYVWHIESDISMYYWWAHLDVWEEKQNVQTCCHTVVTLPSYSIPVSRKFTKSKTL